MKIVYAPWSSSISGYEMITKANFPNGLKAEYMEIRTWKEHRKCVPMKISILNRPIKLPILSCEVSLSIRWSGDLVPSVSGKYTLAFATDDGCRLYLNGKKLIDSWHNRGVQTDSVVVELNKGEKYNCVAEYFDDGAEATAKLYWRVPDVGRKLYSIFTEKPDGLFASAMLRLPYWVSPSLSNGRDRTDIR